MAKSVAVMVVCLVVVLAATVDVGWCWKEDQGAQDKVNDVTSKLTKGSLEDAKDNAGSWFQRVFGKFTGSPKDAGDQLGKAKDVVSDTANQAADKASDLASDAKKTLSENIIHATGRASNAYNAAANKANQAQETIGTNSAQEAYNSASDMVVNAKENLGRKAQHATGKASDFAGDAKEQASDSYNYATHKVGEAGKMTGDAFATPKEKKRGKGKARKSVDAEVKKNVAQS